MPHLAHWCNKHWPGRAREAYSERDTTATALPTYLVGTLITWQYCKATCPSYLLLNLYYSSLCSKPATLCIGPPARLEAESLMKWFVNDLDPLESWTLARTSALRHPSSFFVEHSNDCTNRDRVLHIRIALLSTKHGSAPRLVGPLL